ncbi:endo-1,4-beta-glucanase [Bacidia gigantensis]|uniref:endo-1,4-beta-glucanase n=1 Tax=Bacidia gigantensis TaxID=2732470 RepID=UPI001D046E60|nr:endo-1,4-beta-glucanase [Bacidia gigantensis]KAG8529356.1 endo-1,4-beta-glucanase [Bacidia gigantensis]
MAPLRLRIDGQRFRDNKNREVTLRGINAAADAKFPSRPDVPNYRSDNFFDGDDLSFNGRPFPIEEAHTHFSRLKRWGYNTIRYIFTWEAIEHAGPGQYDEDWIQHTIAVLRLAKAYGFYIFMDPHQDVWSRFTGGSGAPLWTIYACGLNPRKFLSTQAALVHNTWPNPAEYPKMIWATNYTRLACQVILTLFWGGKDFAPKAILDGKNIQDYLQDHFVDACHHLALRIKQAGDLVNEVVIGWESMNEPNRGLIGWQDITVIPTDQKLQKGTSPTAWQAILTGSGRACEIDTWDFGGLGPYKSGSELVDPKGDSAWLPADYDDSRYGWSRDPGWIIGECLWAQHGVWDRSNDQVLRADYFAKAATGKKVDYEYFTNNYFMPYYRKHKKALTSVHKDAIMFCQPPVLEIPPSLKGTEDDDPNMVYAPHYYDGVTLMMKKWNRYWNVDVFGLLRGRYLSPAFAIKVGETAIRNCFRDQLSAIRKEGMKYMGNHPCIFTEIGIPYDMDDKYAYKTGDFSSQSSAMDANHFALEGCGANGYTLWVYMCTNNHEWGDLWNGEDLSIFSLDDKPLPLHPHSNAEQPGPPSRPNSMLSVDKHSPSYSQSQSADTSPIFPENVKAALKTPSISSEANPGTSAELADAPGYRAAEAYVRPSPIATVGDVVNYGFDLRNCIFTFSLDCKEAATNDRPTEIFIPEFHFPRDLVQVEVSSGKWTISVDDADGGWIQRMKWVHGVGQQKVTIRGVQRRQGMALGKEEEEGYLEQCRRCVVM